MSVFMLVDLKGTPIGTIDLDDDFADELAGSKAVLELRQNTFENESNVIKNFTLVVKAPSA